MGAARSPARRALDGTLLRTTHSCPPASTSDARRRARLDAPLPRASGSGRAPLGIGRAGGARAAAAAHERDERLQGLRDLSAARIVDEEGTVRAPFLEQRHQTAVGEIRQRVAIGEKGDADAGDRSPQRHVHVVDDQRALHGDLEVLAATLEHPPQDRAIPVATELDAFMSAQILWIFRRGMRCEIGGRSDRNDADLAPDLERDHILLDALADADAGVEVLLHDVGVGIVDRYFEVDVRILGEEIRDQRRQERDGGGARHAQPQRSHRLVAERRDGFGGPFDPLHDRLHVRQEPLAGLRERDAAGGPVQQAHPEAVLERADGLAQCRRRDAKIGGGLGEAVMFGNGDEGAQLGEIRSAHSSAQRNKAL